MAQYKSFAPKGNFADFQITIPDQSRQIEKETARQLRGMEAAQAFKEKNDAIYLSALKLKFSEEEAQREKNFEAEIESKKAFHEQERLKYQNQIQGEAINAQRKLKGFKDLAEFSKTAFSVYAQIDESFKKSEQAALHQIALDSGLNFEDLQAIRGIEQKLTRSQFNQIEFIQRKIEGGASPAQVNALFKAYERSGSNQWFNVTSVYQNSALSHSAYLDQGLKDYLESFEGKKEQPSIEEITAKAKSLNAEFIQSKFAGARPEVLESAGIYTEMRSTTRTLLRGYHEANSKELALKLKDGRFKTLAAVYKTDKMAGIHREITTNPSARSRIETLEWVGNGVKTGVIPPDKALDLVTNKFDQNQSLLERFGGTKEMVYFMEAVELQRKTANANYREIVELEKAEKVDAAYRVLNEELDSTGRIQEENFRAQEEALLLEGADPNAIAKFKSYLADIQTSNYADQRFEDRYNRSGILPTIDELNNYTGLTAEVRNKWEAKIKERDNNPIIKEHIKAIRDQVKAAPEIQALGSAAASGTVAIMASRRVQSYLKNAAIFGYPKAFAIEMETTQKIQAADGAFDARGNYTVIMNELASDRAKAKIDAAALNAAIDVIKTTPTTRRDFKELSAAMGASVVYGNLGNLNNGIPTSALFNNIANKLNMSPYELAKTLNKANNLDILKGPVWDRMEELAAESNKGKRLLNSYPLPERIIRARTMIDLSGAAASVRGSFVGNTGGLPRTVSSGEGGTNSVNRGRAGDTPGGAQSIFGKPLSEMTFAEVNQAQNVDRVFAVGAYQFTPGVLNRARRDAGLPENALMTLENQTKAFWGLLYGDPNKPSSQAKRPKLAAYLRGESDDLNAAHRELSLEFAAVIGPDGRGAYDNDSAGNYGTIEAQRVREALIQARAEKPRIN